MLNLCFVIHSCCSLMASHHIFQIRAKSSQFASYSLITRASPAAAGLRYRLPARLPLARVRASSFFPPLTSDV